MSYRPRSDFRKIAGGNESGKSLVLFISAWMDMMRALAVSAVVIHHWLLFLPHQSPVPVFDALADFVQEVGGTFIHLFFILSGCGLTISYFGRDDFSWGAWTKRRLARLAVPYWIVIGVTFGFVNLLHYASPGIFEASYSMYDLLAYLTFMRNFYTPSWGLNETMWFIPVIVGLYISFPLLVRVLKEYGPFHLLGSSILVTYVSISLCPLVEYPVAHQSALFLFYVIEFSTGIYIGYVLFFRPYRFKRLLGPKMFFFGLTLYIASWALGRFWKLGADYNDLI